MRIRLNKLLFLTACWGLALGSSAIHAQAIPAGTTIATCGDGAGWPPYTFFEFVEGQQTETILGYDVDILNAILPQHDLKVVVDMPPWKRCLSEADKGEKYQIALSSSFNEERNKTYLLTRHYYTVTPHYFYFKEHFPDGLSISSIDDFSNYRVCGLFGYNYAGFKIPKESIDSGTKNFPRLIEKTRRKRCDVFLARFEIFAGFALSGSDYIGDNGLGNAPVPDAPADKFYMLISRNFEYAEALKKLLDDGISGLEQNGSMDTLLNKYLGS